jgi:hypothetical protein
MVPGHCYLAFSLDAEGNEIAALETTLLGASLDGEPAAIEGVEDVVEPKWAKENSWRTFTGAMAIGGDDLQKNAEKFQDSEEPDYQLIPIAAARKLGILPIAFQSGDFVAAPR